MQQISKRQCNVVLIVLIFFAQCTAFMQLQAACSTAHSFTHHLLPSFESWFKSKPQRNLGFGFGISGAKKHPFLFAGLGLGALGLAAGGIIATWWYRKQISQLLWRKADNPAVLPLLNDDMIQDLNVQPLSPKQQTTQPHPQLSSPQEPAALSELAELKKPHSWALTLVEPTLQERLEKKVLERIKNPQKPFLVQFNKQGWVVLPQAVVNGLKENLQSKAVKLSPQTTLSRVKKHAQQVYNSVRIGRELTQKIPAQQHVDASYFNNRPNYEIFKLNYPDKEKIITDSLAQFGLEGPALKAMVQTVLVDARAGKDIVLAILNGKIEDIPEYKAVKECLPFNDLDDFVEWEMGSKDSVELRRWNYEQLFVKLASFLYLMSAEKRPDGTVKGFKEGTFKIAGKRFKKLFDTYLNFIKWLGNGLGTTEAMEAENPYAYYRKQSHGFKESFGIDIHEKAGSFEHKAFLGQFKHFLCGTDDNGCLWFKPEAAGLEGTVEQLKHLYGYFFAEYEHSLNVGYFNKERLPQNLIKLFEETFEFKMNETTKKQPVFLMIQKAQEQYAKAPSHQDKIRNFIAQVKGNLDLVELRNGKEVIAAPAKMLIETLRYEKNTEATDWFIRIRYFDEIGKDIAAAFAKEIAVKSDTSDKEKLTTAQKDLQEKYHMHIKRGIDALSERNMPSGLTRAVAKILHKLCRIKQNSQQRDSWAARVYHNTADKNELPFWASKGAFLEAAYNAPEQY